MRTTRIYVPIPLNEGDDICLPESATVHIIKVLRLKTGDPLVLFNGKGGQYDAKISSTSKKTAGVKLVKYQAIDH